MEFFGLTYLGPQNYIKDIMKPGYSEPRKLHQVKPTMEKVFKQSTCPKNFTRPDPNVIRLIDCYLGRVNGFALGSTTRFIKMKRKGILKPMDPPDMFRRSPTTAMEYGWFLCDPALENQTWYKTDPRYPKPAAPNTLILDAVRKNDKYATLF